MDHTQTAPSARRARPTRRRSSHRTISLILAVALLAAGAVIAWALTRSSDEGSGQNRATAVPVSEAGLRTLAGTLDRPIYWAGPIAGRTYELTQTPDERVYVRYLPADAKVGVAKPYLTVGTYRVHDAFATTKAAAARKGAIKVEIGGGGVAFYNTRVPQSVYLAYPNSDYQIEVYHPSGARAHRLVAAGRIAAVKPDRAAAKPRPSAVGVSEKGLKTLAGVLNQPLYWAGAEADVTYELTQTPDSRLYVRYLPPGVEVGAKRAYLTVGTYPVRDAYAVIRSAARQNGTVTIRVAGGGVAFYSRRVPSSVYLAYPRSDYEIEVYDPSPERAHQLVRSGRVTAVR
jgi:hypothetical protein